MDTVAVHRKWAAIQETHVTARASETQTSAKSRYNSIRHVALLRRETPE
jgi:hypothetical protein